METVIKIILIGIIGTVFSILLKKDMPVFSVVISVSVGIVIFFYISEMLGYVIASVKNLFLKTSLNEDLLQSVLKICAIGIVSEYFCSVIKDAGEEGISKKIELGAKTVIFMLMLPIVISVIESIWGTLK